ncbi:unnamed protein product [Prorocentrum cordatum]|uniref:Uncharacterized protein n=1 Tax=Prorocentrum cordatum TaxID=2364126 RepID=A0ABN9U534_9DINO|nr:unnamed protein product [Polarella glacialis]
MTRQKSANGAKTQKATYTTCISCGNWAWDWRLRKQHGKCKVCGSHVSGFENEPWIRSQHTRAPWDHADQSAWSAPAWAPPSKDWPSLPPKAEPAQLLQQYLKVAGLSSDSTALQLAHQFEEAAERIKPKPKAKCPYVVLREATSLCAQTQAKLAKASKQLLSAEAWLEECKGRQLAAADELFEADQARLVAQEATQSGGAGVKTETAAAEGGEATPHFGVDPQLFQDLDDYEGDKQKLLQFQRELDDIATQDKAREQQFKELLASAKQALRAPRKRRRADGGQAKADEAEGAAAEATPGAAAADGSGGGAGSQDQPSAEERARLLPLAATLLLSRLPCTSAGGMGASSGDATVFYSSITEWGPQARRFLTEKYYDHSVVALAETHQGANALPQLETDLEKAWSFAASTNDIMVALASFTRALADPRLAVADWNCEPPSLVASGWAPQLQARLEVPQNCKATCGKGPGRLYDYVLASYTCPDISLQAVQSAPWKTHCGALITTKGARKERWVSKLDAYFGKKTTLELAAAWVADAAILEELGDGALDHFAQLAQRWSDWAPTRAMMASRASFMASVREQWRVKPGLVHRHVKPDPPPEWEGAGPDGCPTSHPHLLLEGKRQHWSGIWREQVDTQEDLHYWLDQLHSDALEEALPPFELDQLTSTLRAMPSNKAQGVDALGPNDALRLPDVGRRALVNLLNEIELSGVWPEELMTALGASIPKEAGGHRVLGLMPHTANLWSRTESARTTVIGDMKSAAQSIAQLFKDNRLTISDKTKLVASDDALGSSLVTSLKSMGIPVTLTPSAVDLGVDAAGQACYPLLLMAIKLMGFDVTFLLNGFGCGLRTRTCMYALLVSGLVFVLGWVIASAGVESVGAEGPEDYTFLSFGEAGYSDTVLEDFNELLADLEHDCRAAARRLAAKHPDGEQLAGGADLHGIQRELDAFAKKGAMDM